jgi:hypothetical protein
MKLQRIRYLLVFFLAVFVVNGVAAATRACTLSQVRHEHSAAQRLQAAPDPTCPEAAATPCVAHCVQEAKSAEQKVPVVADSPAAFIAPPLVLSHASFPRVQAMLPVALSQPVVGPPLTILFGNLRN